MLWKRNALERAIFESYVKLQEAQNHWNDLCDLGLSENVVYPIVPNGFADHHPYEKWLAIIGKINPTFSGPNPSILQSWPTWEAKPCCFGHLAINLNNTHELFGLLGHKGYTSTTKAPRVGLMTCSGSVARCVFFPLLWATKRVIHQWDMGGSKKGRPYWDDQTACWPLHHRWEGLPPYPLVMSK